MTDPWVDERERTETARRYVDAGWPAWNWHVYSLQDAERLLTDATALLAVVRDQLPKVHNPVRCEHDRIVKAQIGDYMHTDGPEPCEVCDAVAVLPEHLREEA